MIMPVKNILLIQFQLSIYAFETLRLNIRNLKLKYEQNYWNAYKKVIECMH